MFRPFSQARRQFVITALTVICFLAAVALISDWQPGKLAAKQPLANQPHMNARSAPLAAFNEIPEVQLNVEGMEFPNMGLIGEKFCYTARLENTGNMAGYGPYIQLVLPPKITIQDPGDVSLPGVCNQPACTPSTSYPITPTNVFTCPSTNTTPCNISDGLGASAVVPPGFTLWTIQAPIGSLYPSEPGIDLKICLKMADDAPVIPATLLDVCHTPVFQHGNSPLGTTPTVGAPNCPQIMPTVVKLTKNALQYTSNKKAPAPTVEIPTGSCHAITYELVANIADSKSLTNIQIQDQLPVGMTLVPNSVTVQGVGSFNNCSATNVVCVNNMSDQGAPGTPPDEFEKRDIVVQFQAYANNNVLNNASCNSALLTNTATLDAQYNLTAIPQQTAQLLIEVEHVTIQKTASGPNPNDPLHVMPGDNVTYKLSFQVSENTNTNNVVITDVIPNGVELPLIPTATLMCAGSPTSFLQPNTVTTNGDGTKTLTFQLGNLAACTNCMLTYGATVQETYRAPLAGQNVLASDPLIPSCGSPSNPLNCTKITYNITGGASGCSDDTAGGVIVKPTDIEKSLVTPQPPNGFVPGDLVTFKLKICIPSGDTKDIVLTDFLPSPIFNAAQVSGVMLTQTGFSGATVMTTANTTDNSLKFEIKNPSNPNVISTVNAGTVCFEVKFSVPVTTQPFADDLYLTNLLQSKNTLTNGTMEGHLTGLVIHVRAPKLKITKGVLTTTNPFANTLSGLPDTTAPFDSNVTGVDAGDQVTFNLAVKNEGGAPAYAVILKDFLPPCFKFISSTPGTGTPTPTLTITGLLNGGKTLDFNFGTNVLAAGATWNIQVVVQLPPHPPVAPNDLNCELPPEPCRVYTNNSQATWSSECSVENPGQCIPSPAFPAVTDAATVEIAKPAITKTIVSTNQAHTTGTNVAIGEKVKYMVRIRVPEGRGSNVVIMDTLDPGLAVVDATITPTKAAAITTSNPFTCSITPGPGPTGGGMITCNLGTVINSDLANGTDEFIEFMYEAVVLNVPGNVQGTMLKNTVKWTSTECANVSLSSTPVKVVEPKLQITKTPSVQTADAGDVITWTITISNTSPSDADAFQVTLNDVIPANHTFVNGSLMLMSGLAPTTGPAGGTSNTPITATWNTFPFGSTSMIKFQTTVGGTVKPCDTITNQAAIAWASLPGALTQISPWNTNSCPRTGGGSCGSPNNYTATATGVVSVPGPKITKSYTTSLAATVDPNVTIGEVVTYSLKVELPEGVTPSLVVKDVVPPGMSIVGVTGKAGSGIPTANIPNPTITPTTVACPNVSGATVTLTYGSITVPADGITTNNFVLITLTAIVCDSPANMGMFTNNQTMLTNTAMAATGAAQPPNCVANSNPVTLKVVEPKLRISKNFDPSTVTEGGMTSIVLAVSNIGLSTAYNVVIEDLLPLALFGNADITTCATPPAGFVFSKPIVGANTAATFTGGNINVGQTLTFCIKVTVKQRCRMDMFNNIATVKHAFTLPPPDCAPDCTRPGVVNELQGREEGGAKAEAKLNIQPGPNCTCFGETLPNGFKRPPAYTNMVEWLKFDETIGDEAGDSSAANNDGTLLPTSQNGPNGPMRMAGMVQNALMFDGVDDYVEVADNNSLDLGTSSFTIDAWINPAPSSLNGLHTIVDKRSFAPGSGSNAPGYKFFLLNGQLALQINDGTPFNFIAPAGTNLSPYANQWVHVTVTCARTATANTATFYVDGVVIHTQTTGQVLGSLNNSSPLYVGRGVPHDADFYQGKIDELEIFNVALPTATIAGIANAGKFGKCLPTPPYECCGRKPVFPDVPGAPEATYSTFTGQVLAVTCYAFNVNDPAVAVVDLKNQASAPLDSNWFPGTSSTSTAFYHHPSWSQANLGDVFGLTLDGGGNVFVAASSAYRRGGSGVSGPQLSHKATAGPGGIYRLPVGTGIGAATPQIFVSTSNTTTYSGGNQLPNQDPLGTGGTLTEAPGLGNLTFDCRTNMFYVTNFEDGLIYRINAAGTILDQWNHGANISPAILDDTQVGLTQLGRRVWAVKVYNNRLYYSVWRNDGGAKNGLHNEIWSVGLGGTGAFVGPQQLEISLPFLTLASVLQTWSSPVSDISFMDNGTMLLAERSMVTPQTSAYSNPFVSAHVSRALEYVYTGVLWQATSKTLEVGRGPAFPTRAGTNASGGIDIDRRPGIGRIWTTGDALHYASGDLIYGLQGMPSAGTSGLLTATSILIDLDGSLAGGDKFQIGDVQLPCFTCRDVVINISPDMLPSGVAGQNYSSPTLTATGGTPGYTFTVTGLPMGLSLNGSQMIVGVPMEAGTFNVTVMVTDANGCVGRRFYQIVIAHPVITIGPASLSEGMVGMAYSSTFTASGGCGQYVFTQAGGTLPPGLTLAPNGTLSGTPTTCGTYVFTIKATDKCGCLETQTYSLTVSGQQQPITGLFNTGVDNNNVVLPDNITDPHYTVTQPDGTTIPATARPAFNPWIANSPTSKWIGFQSAAPNTTFTYTTTFTLPNCPGLSAEISGQWASDDTSAIFLNGVQKASLPNVVSSNFLQLHPFTINSDFNPGLNTLTVVVNNSNFGGQTGLRLEWAGTFKCCPCQLVLGPDKLDSGTVNLPYNDQVEPIGGAAPYMYTTAGNLPPGVIFTNGVFTGTPTTPGTYTYTVTVTDANGCTAIRTFTIIIGCHVVIFDPPFLSAGFVGSAYNRVLGLTGGIGTVTWSTVSGSLPPGITLSANGTLSGTPTAAGVFNFRVQAIDASTCATTKDYTLEITCPPIVVAPPATIPAARVGQVFSATFTASGGAAPYTFTRIGGLLPPGLTLATTGVLSGTPTTAGTFAFTLQAASGNGCAGTLQFSLTVCGDIAVNPANTALPIGRVGQIYSQVFSQTGATGPTTWRVGPGTAPPGLSLNELSGILSGTPTQTGTFNFTVAVADETGCPGSRAYSLTVVDSGNGLQFYPLPAPVRALETRPGFNGCATPGAPINANTSLILAVRTGCTGIPANATAVTGNVTVVPGTTGGFLTLFPSSATQPIVANSNFKPGEVTNNVFTTGLGAGDGAFKIFASATTEVIVDVTGYYAPPSAQGLYFHPLPEPVRLLETRTIPGLLGCIKPGAQLAGGQDFSVQGRSPVAAPCNVIPAAAQVLVGNATSVFPAGAGFLTIFPSDAVRPVVASSNYAGADVINGPFAVKLGADGKFKVYTHATTELVIDILGYYSAEASDANGAGLLFNPLDKPVRLLETRPDPGFPLTGCYRPNAKIMGGTGGIRTQQSWGTCEGLTIPTTARAIIGNATVVNVEGAGFMTFYPGNVGTAPTVATSNYPFPVVFGYNRHFVVGVSPTDGTFKILTQFTTDLIVDVAGYFAP